MTLPLFLAGPAATASPGSSLALTGEEARHASQVRRIRTGEEIYISDGAGTRATCTVTDISKREVLTRVLEVERIAAPSCPITLVQALAKGGRDEQAVETATEFGAWDFLPWQSERTVVRWRGKEEKGVARWQAVARAAAKQSRRAYVPCVHEPVTTNQLTAQVSAAVETGACVLICHESASLPLTQVAAVASAQAVWIIIGPEGGISSGELAALEKAGGVPVLLAPHVLRAATAGPYALATVHALRATARYDRD